MSRGPRRRLSRGWWLLVSLAVVGVLVLTLRPDEVPGISTGTNLRPFHHHGRALHALFGDGTNRRVVLHYLVTDVVGNVLLFLPVGLAVAGALGRLPAPPLLAASVAFGALLSAGIEAVQLLIPGRATDVDDVIFNTLGALVGTALYLVVRRWRRARGGGSRRRSWPWAW
jgi:VanZ family protein